MDTCWGRADRADAFGVELTSCWWPGTPPASNEPHRAGSPSFLALPTKDKAQSGDGNVWKQRPGPGLCAGWGRRRRGGPGRPPLSPSPSALLRRPGPLGRRLSRSGQRPPSPQPARRRLGRDLCSSHPDRPLVGAAGVARGPARGPQTAAAVPGWRRRSRASASGAAHVTRGVLPADDHDPDRLPVPPGLLGLHAETRSSDTLGDSAARASGTRAVAVVACPSHLLAGRCVAAASCSLVPFWSPPPHASGFSARSHPGRVVEGPSQSSMTGPSAGLSSVLSPAPPARRQAGWETLAPIEPSSLCRAVL